MQAAALDAWDQVVESRLDLDLVAAVSGLIVCVNVPAALPVRHVSRVDPQEVFKA